MRRTIWLFALAAGCSGGTKAGSGGGGDTTVSGHPTAGGSVTVAAPAIPTAGYDTKAAELNDHLVFERMRHRVRLAREGVAYLKQDGPRVDDTGAASTLDTRPMFPVLEESNDRVRIVTEDDHARVALWVDRSDCAETTLASVQVSDPSGHAPAGAGVWLGAGASLDSDQRKAAPGYREVTLRSQWLRATGYVPEAALGNIWVANEHEGYEASTSEDDAKPPVATGKTISPTVIRATPDADGAVVAEVLKAAPVRVVHPGAAGSGFSEVEVHVPRVRVKGFAPTSALADGDKLDDHRFSHSRDHSGTGTRLHVPSGSCLYDAAGGAVAGLTTADSDRYVNDKGAGVTKSAGWWPVMIYTEWGTLTAYVHDTQSATDVKLAVLESCLKK